MRGMLEFEGRRLENRFGIRDLEGFDMRIAKLIEKMTEYYAGDPQQIQHFMKVHNFARTIGVLEQMDEGELFVLETAAVVHDIGIKVAREKYGSSNGKYQEQEGPAVARELLGSLGYEKETTERVCYLVGHHHTYTDIDGLDYQILVEADFLVNIFEEGMSREAAENVFEKIFKTGAGKELCRQMFVL